MAGGWNEISLRSLPKPFHDSVHYSRDWKLLCDSGARTASIVSDTMLLLVLTCPTRAVMTNNGTGKYPRIVKHKGVISLRCDRICDKEVWTGASSLSRLLLFSSGYE